MKHLIVTQLPETTEAKTTYLIEKGTDSFNMVVTDDNNKRRALSLPESTVIQNTDTPKVELDYIKRSELSINYVNVDTIYRVPFDEVPIEYRREDANPVLGYYNKITNDLVLDYEMVVNKSIFNPDTFKVKEVKILRTNRVHTEEFLTIQDLKHYSESDETQKVWLFFKVKVRMDNRSKLDNFYKGALIQTKFEFNSNKVSYEINESNGVYESMNYHYYEDSLPD